MSDGHHGGVLPILGLRHEFRPHRQVAGPRECWSFEHTWITYRNGGARVEPSGVAVPLQDPRKPWRPR